MNRPPNAEKHDGAADYEVRYSPNALRAQRRNLRVGALLILLTSIAGLIRDGYAILHHTQLSTGPLSHTLSISPWLELPVCLFGLFLGVYALKGKTR
jgi:hypothetical protein